MKGNEIFWSLMEFNEFERGSNPESPIGSYRKKHVQFLKCDK